jgi:hypothetical protein
MITELKGKKKNFSRRNISTRFPKGAILCIFLLFKNILETAYFSHDSTKVQKASNLNVKKYTVCRPCLWLANTPSLQREVKSI